MAARLFAILRWALGALLGLLVVASGVLLWLARPLGDRDLASHPRPARSYEEAVARFEQALAAEPGDLNPVCRSRLLTHGRRTGRVIVLFHGFTNCPQQFESLGELLYARGANVLILRVPHHGSKDVLTRELQRLTSREMVHVGDESVDIARGLGDSVTVAGLSMGANIAAWLAEERPDVDRAVVIAPLFGVASLWPQLTPALERGLLAAPDRPIWWSDSEKERVGGPPYAYPRFSTQALGQSLRLGLWVMEQSRRRAPQARSILMVTVGDDPAICNAAAADVERAWSRRAPGRVASYEFSPALRLGHDLIDPLQPHQKIRVVYPLLSEMMWPK